MNLATLFTLDIENMYLEIKNVYLEIEYKYLDIEYYKYLDIDNMYYCAKILVKLMCSLIFSDCVFCNATRIGGLLEPFPRRYRIQ